MKHKILAHLPGDFPWQVHWFPTVCSTNTLAKEMALEGAPHGTVILAGHQTGGRGRMGRSFSSPEGLGLYLSLILRPNCPASALMHLTCAAGLAACDAVESAAGFRPGIKWINDLVADSRKLGGILTEMSVNAKTGLVDYAVIGIGINCLQKKEDFPPELQSIAVSLKTITGQNVEIANLAAQLILSLHQMAENLFAPDSIMELYRKDCVTLGKEIAVISSSDTRHGTALDIDNEGALIVRFQNGAVETVNSGEVSVRGLWGYL